MASVSLPAQPISTLTSPLDGGVGSKLYSSRSPTLVEPNPPFVFPPREAPPSPSVESSVSKSLESAAMADATEKATSEPEPNPPFAFPAQEDSSTSSASGTISSRRSTCRPSSQRSTALALPPFTFNPSQAGSEPVSPESPTMRVTVPPRTDAHRRHGSEFIGGDGQLASPGLMSSSPTKGEGSLPPPVSNLGPPGGRRSHSHRRSGAISTNDLSSVIKPTSSVPKSPYRHSPEDLKPTFPDDPSSLEVDKSPNQKAGTSYAEWPPRPKNQTPSEVRRTPPASPSRRESAPGAVPRPRVGFSDNLEFIPRPLSTISSESSSSVSTARGNHSLTGSITSIVSGASSPANKSGRLTPGLSTTFEENAPSVRPKTAEPLSSEMPQCVTTKRPLSASASPEVSSTKKKHFWDSDVSPKSTPVVEQPDFMPDKVYTTSVNSSNTGSDLSLPRPKTSPERKASKKQKKVRSWAGNIISRKGKSRASKGATPRRSPTPPLLDRNALDFASLSDVNFDEDNTIIIQTPARSRVEAPRLQTTPAPESFQPSNNYGGDADVTSPVIDLDAALGPFNTPELGLNKGINSGFSEARRHMHSGGQRGGFDGPEGNYHRRAESAPELVPVHRGSFGMHRLGSNSSMGDVFDEEEEDHYLAGKEPSAQGDSAAVSNTSDANSATTSMANAVGDSTAKPNTGISEVGSNATPISDDLPTAEKEKVVPSNAADAHTEDNFGLGVKIVDSDDPMQILQDGEWTSSAARSSGSTVTPTLLQDSMEKQLVSSPIDFAYPATQTSYASSEMQGSNPNSAFPSPDPSHVSFDTHARFPTSASSMNDRQTFNSYNSGERGLEVRASVDDVPSLSSSVSTNTNAMPRFSSSAGTQSSAERPASFSAASGPRMSRGNATKRASLASLSKLMGGSSKLRYEETVPDDETEKTKKKKKKKGNRLSRFMHFWRSKEKEGSTDTSR